jgi:hypothetical protein
VDSSYSVQKRDPIGKTSIHPLRETLNPRMFSPAPSGSCHRLCAAGNPVHSALNAHSSAAVRPPDNISAFGKFRGANTDRALPIAGLREYAEQNERRIGRPRS